jgi:Fur family ferric uptake transcriptional regulator
MDERKALGQYLRNRGLKITQQRQDIAQTFLQSGRHLSADELHQKVRGEHPQVGLATIYRTLKLLVEAGLASQREFGDGITRYEPLTSDQHHDHLICINCGAIIEFENKKIEDLQNEVAGRKKFTVLRHKLELYGYCDRCRRFDMRRSPDQKKKTRLE